MTAINTKRLRGKVALVTGGSGGIGKAIVERLAAEGAVFIGVHYGSRRTAADEVVKQVERLGSHAVALQADFRTNAQAEAQNLWRLFAKAARQHTGQGDADILINCAGVAPLATLDATTETLYDEVFSINLASTFFLIQAASQHIRSGGRIVNLSSALTRIAAPARAAYAASKGAINALTLALAADFGPRGITVNAIAPGVIDTEMNGGWLSDPAARRAAEAISVFSRIGNEDDVTGLVAFLASDDGRWTTGQVIDASGGSNL